MTYNTAIRDLLVRVPGPPGEDLPKGIGDADFDGFSMRTGIAIPGPLREFLTMTNGPCVGPGGLFGIRTLRPHLDMESYLESHPTWKIRRWIPIAGDGCGNYYVLCTQGEFGPGLPVVFIDTSMSDGSPSFIVASDLRHFLTFLLEKELGRKEWPFDKTTVTQRDPDIVSFHDVRLPWETTSVRVEEQKGDAARFGC